MATDIINSYIHLLTINNIIFHSIRIVWLAWFARRRARWEQNFAEVPEPLSEEEKAKWMATADKIVLSSDAFFPFRDNIDVAAKLGVKYISQPGGSVQDANIIECCDEYNMAMAMTGVRLFHH